MSEVKPVLRVLTRKQREAVHHYACRILAETGVRVDWPEARDRLDAGGCRISGNGRVLFPETMIQEAISTAPKTVTMFDRKGREAFVVGASQNARTRFGVGVTNLFYQNPLTDELTPFQLAHVSNAVRLANRLPRFDLVSTPGIAKDRDPGKADLEVTTEMVANTIKPLVLLVSEHRLFDPVLDLVAHLHPENTQKPFAIPYVNPITPLVMNAETLQKVISTVQRGLPLIYNNYGMSGATAPITPAGTLALLTAELLAGLAFAQIVKPGSAVILGSLPAGFDMRAMMSVYTPVTVMLNLACAEMMAHYRLPHSGTSGSGPGWGADLMAGGALWLNHLTACMGKVGLAPFVGGNLDSMAFSPASVVYADEVIGQARQFSGGFGLSGDAVSLDQIDRIGPAGSYLASKQTLALFRDFSDQAPLWPVMSLDSWQEARCPRAETQLRQHTAALLADTPGPGDMAHLRAEGIKFIADLNIKGDGAVAGNGR